MTCLKVTNVLLIVLYTQYANNELIPMAIYKYIFTDILTCGQHSFNMGLFGFEPVICITCEKHPFMSWSTRLFQDTFCRCSHRLHISEVEVLCPFLLSVRTQYDLELKFICAPLSVSIGNRETVWWWHHVNNKVWENQVRTRVENFKKLYCFSQQDQLLSNNTMCFNSCQHCISSWFLRRIKEAEIWMSH